MFGMDEYSYALDEDEDGDEEAMLNKATIQDVGNTLTAQTKPSTALGPMLTKVAGFYTGL